MVLSILGVSGDRKVRLFAAFTPDRQAALTKHDTCRDKDIAFFVSGVAWWSVGGELSFACGPVVSFRSFRFRQTSSPRWARSMSGQNYPSTFSSCRLGWAGLRSDIKLCLGAPSQQPLAKDSAENKQHRAARSMSGQNSPSTFSSCRLG